MQEGEVNMTKKEMRKEAADRMRLLGLLDEKEQSVIRDFEEEHKVYVSRTRNLYASPMNQGVMVGVLYEWSDEERTLVEKVENQFQILVYHMIRNVTNVGILYAMLSVSSYEEEWTAERKALKGIKSDAANPLAYVWNAGLQEEEALDLSKGFGEWGSILIVEGEGGLCQIFPDYE